MMDDLIPTGVWVCECVRVCVRVCVCVCMWLVGKVKTDVGEMIEKKFIFTFERTWLRINYRAVGRAIARWRHKPNATISDAIPATALIVIVIIVIIVIIRLSLAISRLLNVMFY